METGSKDKFRGRTSNAGDIGGIAYTLYDGKESGPVGGDVDVSIDECT